MTGMESPNHSPDPHGFDLPDAPPTRWVKYSAAEVEAAIRAKIGATTNPDYRRKLRSELARLLWATRKAERGS